MTAIRAGLNRNLYKVNINFSTITDRVQAGKVEVAREDKISSTKHKPAMIPRDVEILYEEKQLVLPSSNKFNPQPGSSAMVSDFVAGSIQCQVSKESAPIEIRQKQPVASYSTAGSASISSQVVFGW